MGRHAEPAGFHADFVRLRLGQGQHLPPTLEFALAWASWLVVDPVPDDAHDVHGAAFQGSLSAGLGARADDRHKMCPVILDEVLRRNMCGTCRLGFERR